MSSAISPTELWAGIFTVIIVCALVWFLSVRRKAQRAVRGRSALSASQFAALFNDPTEAAIAPLIRDQLRGYISVEPELVRPDDKLCAELQLAAVDGLDANSFIGDVELATNTKIPDRMAERMLTLRDIVSFVALVRRERAT